jgi:CBS domain-containing protein
MKLLEVMTKDVEVAFANSTLKECAQKMKALDIGALPVCDQDRLLGMITDRDLCLRGLAEGLDPDTTYVKEIVSKPIIYSFENDDVESAVRIMETRQIRRLAVLDKNKRLVGVVSLGDIAVRTGNEPLSGEVLEKVSEPMKQKVA